MIVNARREYDFRGLLQIGALGLQNILRFVPPCTVIIWNWQWLRFVAGPGPVPLPDPWAQPPGDPVIHPEVVSQALLGGAVVELARSRRGFQETHLACARRSGTASRSSRPGFPHCGRWAEK